MRPGILAAPLLLPFLAVAELDYPPPWVITVTQTQFVIQCVPSPVTITTYDGVTTTTSPSTSFVATTTLYPLSPRGLMRRDEPSRPERLCIKPASVEPRTAAGPSFVYGSSRACPPDVIGEVSETEAEGEAEVTLGQDDETFDGNDDDYDDDDSDDDSNDDDDDSDSDSYSDSHDDDPDPEEPEFYDPPWPDATQFVGTTVTTLNSFNLSTITSIPTSSETAVQIVPATYTRRIQTFRIYYLDGAGNRACLSTSTNYYAFGARAQAEVFFFGDPSIPARTTPTSVYSATVQIQVLTSNSPFNSFIYSHRSDDTGPQSGLYELVCVADPSTNQLTCTEGGGATSYNLLGLCYDYYFYIAQSSIPCSPSSTPPFYLEYV